MISGLSVRESVIMRKLTRLLMASVTFGLTFLFVLSLTYVGGGGQHPASAGARASRASRSADETWIPLDQITEPEQKQLYVVQVGVWNLIRKTK